MDSLGVGIQTIPEGYCQCGCGGKTNGIVSSRPKLGLVKGEPYRFLPGHNIRGNCIQTGPKHNNWKGGKSLSSGYPVVLMPGHPRASVASKNYVFEHILIAEKALGKPLPLTARVHHHGPIKDQCLVICENNAYHLYIEARYRAWKACGHADWRKCRFCQKYDEPSNLLIHDRHVQHASCDAQKRRERKANREVAVK